MLTAVTTGVIATAIWAVGVWVARTGAFGMRARAYLALKPRSDLRVSVASLACLEVDGKVLLKESRKRPGTLEPFGGVRLVFDAGVDELKSRGYRPQALGTNEPMANACDLRGFLRPRNFLWLRREIENSHYIEEATAGCRREVVEELQELGCPLTVPTALSLRTIRTFEQGPWSAKSYTGQSQYRHFTVVCIRMSDEATRKFVHELFEWAKAFERCEAVTPQEVRAGRATVSGREIANHTALLFEGALSRPDRPLFATG